MDKLAKQLREDAAKINVTVSPELDERLRASLAGVVPERPRAGPEDTLPRSRSTWWASSLTGIVAAGLVIVLINFRNEAPQPAPVETFAMPTLTPELNFQPAVMTAPLQKELEDLEADLKKAEEAVRKDIGLFP